MTPRDELASTKFCLAQPGKEYVVFVPSGQPVTVDLSTTSGRFAIEWLDPVTGQTTAGGAVDAGATRSFTVPVRSDAVLHLRRQ
jgi:hypothetical protein